LSHGGLELY